MRIHLTTYMLSSICALIMVTISIPANAAIKCWTNNEGIRECGNRVPPEFAQQGHQELSNSGMIIDEKSRAKTEEERAQDILDKEKLAEENRLKQESARSDTILLATFSSVEEIELVRDERLRVIQASITLTEKQIETIQMDLNKRISAAAEAERSGKPPNEALLKDIDTLESQVSNKNDYITEKRVELTQTKSEYATNIERHKELKGI